MWELVDGDVMEVEDNNDDEEEEEVVEVEDGYVETASRAEIAATATKADDNM
jgi:hypothetical protein